MSGSDDPELAIRFLHLAASDAERIDRLARSDLRPTSAMRCGVAERRPGATTLPLGVRAG